MLPTKFHGHQSIGSGGDFKGFYQIWAWWPYWSCDQDDLNIFLLSQTLKATYKIWLQLAWWLFRRCLKLSNYGKSWVKGQTMT